MSETVTVIIPAYNRVVYLQETLRSVAQQTYPHVQLIVVDDASTEDIDAVIESIRWPSTMDVQYIRLEQNGGPGRAREMGRQQATGSYIAYLDSDEIWHIDFVATLVETLQSRPECGMAYGKSVSFTSLPITGNEPIRNGYPVEEILPYSMARRPWCTSTCLWRRAITTQIGAWHSGYNSEDIEYEIRAACHGISVAYVPKTLCYVRKGHQDRLTHQQDKPINSAATYLKIAQTVETYNKLDDKNIRHALVMIGLSHFLPLYKQNEHPELQSALLTRLLQLVEKQSILFHALPSTTRESGVLPVNLARWLLIRLASYFSRERRTFLQVIAVCNEKFKQGEG